MLSRPGSPAGSAWMKRLDERLQAMGREAPLGGEGPARWRYWWLWYVVLFTLILGTNLVSGPLTYPSGEFKKYESSLRVAGWPLVAVGERPQAIVAIGSFPVGLIAIGGLPLGVLAIGGVAAGGIAISGVSLGIFALGGLAIGWWATGGGAIGIYALGGLAVGGHAYAGNGVALGYYEASGRQKERLLG